MNFFVAKSHSDVSSWKNGFCSVMKKAWQSYSNRHTLLTRKCHTSLECFLQISSTYQILRKLSFVCLQRGRTSVQGDFFFFCWRRTECNPTEDTLFWRTLSQYKNETLKRDLLSLWGEVTDIVLNLLLTGYHCFCFPYTDPPGLWCAIFVDAHRREAKDGKPSLRASSQRWSKSLLRD